MTRSIYSSKKLSNNFTSETIIQQVKRTSSSPLANVLVPVLRTRKVQKVQVHILASWL